MDTFDQQMCLSITCYTDVGEPASNHQSHEVWIQSSEPTLGLNEFITTLHNDIQNTLGFGIPFFLLFLLLQDMNSVQVLLLLLFSIIPKYLNTSLRHQQQIRSQRNDVGGNTKKGC